ncbi:tol-pal system protein YbgF [Marinomonas transparens]|nr:tol-pal system protein YbgF [Marinomonas transparens]
MFRSFAVVLCSTAPLVMAADSQQPTTALSPSAAAELLFQLETLQQEVQYLNGKLEEQEHELKQMKARQRDRYIDLDKRISLLMSSSVKKEPVAVTAVPSAKPTATPALTIVKVNKQEPLFSSPPIAPISLQPVSPQAQDAYNNAYNFIRQKQYESANSAFTQFVKDFPDNSLTGNGYYWLGELKLVLGEPNEALTSFSTVINKFPGHSKEPDALYKLGIVSDQVGDSAKAKSYLQDVIKRFPEGNTAKLATNYLSNIK